MRPYTKAELTPSTASAAPSASEDHPADNGDQRHHTEYVTERSHPMHSLAEAVYPSGYTITGIVDALRPASLSGPRPLQLAPEIADLVAQGGSVLEAQLLGREEHLLL